MNFENLKKISNNENIKTSTENVLLSSNNSINNVNTTNSSKNIYEKFKISMKIIPAELKIGLVLLLIIITVIIIIKLIETYKKKKKIKQQENNNNGNDTNVLLSSSSSLQNNNWIGISKHQNETSKYPAIPGSVYEHHIISIIRLAAQLNAQTRQSKNLLLKLINATNALTYVNVLEKIANPNTIEEISGINFDEFKEELENEQLNIIQKISTKYPNLQPDSLYTISTGWS